MDGNNEKSSENNTNSDSSPLKEEKTIFQDIKICNHFEKSSDINLKFLQNVWQQKGNNDSELSKSAENLTTGSSDDHRNTADQQEDVTRNVKPKKSELKVRERKLRSSSRIGVPRYDEGYQHWKSFPSDFNDEDEDDFSDDDDNKYENDIYGGSQYGHEDPPFSFMFSGFRSMRIYQLQNVDHFHENGEGENPDLLRPKSFRRRQQLLFFMPTGHQSFLSIDSTEERKTSTRSENNVNEGRVATKSPLNSSDNSSQRLGMKSMEKSSNTMESSASTSEVKGKGGAREFEQSIRISQGAGGVHFSAKFTVSDTESNTSAHSQASIFHSKDNPTEAGNNYIARTGFNQTERYDNNENSATSNPQVSFDDSSNHQVRNDVDQPMVKSNGTNEIEIPESKVSKDASTENKVNTPRTPDLSQSLQFWNGDFGNDVKMPMDIAESESKNTSREQPRSRGGEDTDVSTNNANKPEEFDNIFNPSSNDDKCISRNYETGANYDATRNSYTGANNGAKFGTVSHDGANYYKTGANYYDTGANYGTSGNYGATYGADANCEAAGSREYDTVGRSSQNFKTKLKTEDQSLHCHCRRSPSRTDNPPKYQHTHSCGCHDDHFHDNYYEDDFLCSKCDDHPGKDQGCGNCQNCKSQRMMDMMKALSESIGREIHDVLPDGNCMFRSIIDQLRMQGELDWTSMSLRTKAVEYLRENPHQDDGTHLAEFLPFDGDTWLEYLRRMSKDAEWGDNIILRGLAEVIGRNICIISAFGDLHNQTTVSPSVKRTTPESDDIFLGHINDQHYVSLRRKDWKESWFKCANIIQRRHDIPEISTATAIETNFKVTELSSTIDKYSKVPLYHLNFLLRHTVPEKSIATLPKEFVQGMLHRFSRKRYKPVLYGGEADGLAVFFVKGTVSPSESRQKEEKRSGLPNCAYFIESQEAVVQFENDKMKSLNQFEMHFDGHHPGYLRLHCPAFGEVYPEYVEKTRGGVYLLKGAYKDPLPMSSVYGFKCNEWPAFLISNWVDRNRPSGWPDEDLKEILLSQYIAIVPFSHPESEDRDIEWQMCFAKQEYTLAMSLNSHKKYCFHIYQLLVRYFVGEEPLKRYFLKNIFFRALENISVENWEFSPGACILYLIEQTIFAINTKHLEHYFVSNNNLIDWFTDDSCRILCEKLEAVRKFPVTAILLLAEGYGLMTSWVADLVIDDIPKFTQHEDPRISTLEVFVPAYIKESHTEVHLHYYGRAVKIFWESFTEISRGCVAEVLSFDNFLQRNLNDLGSSDQWWFCFFLDYYYSKSSLQEMFQHYEGIHLYEIVGETEDAGIFGNLKIPYQLMKENCQSESHGYKTSLSTHISFLRTLCTELNREGIYDHSVFYLRILICKLKENIASYRYSQDQVGSVDNEAIGRLETDEMQTAFNSLKKASRENYYLKEAFAIQLNVQLFYTYIHMFNTYQQLGQPELFSEYMEDLESLCYTIATKHAYKQLAEIWWILGAREKYKEAMEKYSS